MDRLILFRHGKAEADSATGEDIDRELAPRGVRESAAMAENLARLGHAPDLALISSSVRTRETWDAAAPAFPDTAVRLEPKLYLADAEAIRGFAALQEGAVMVVAHNPGLQELAVQLLVQSGAPLQTLSRARRSFPPSSAAVFRIDGQGRPIFDGLFFPEGRG